MTGHVRRLLTGATLLALCGCSPSSPPAQTDAAPARPRAQPLIGAVSSAPPNPSGGVSVERSPDGHFWVEARIDGARLRLLLDSGASVVALTAADARRIGLDLDRLSWDGRVGTAAGEVDAAPVTLSHVEIGSVGVSGVRAVVLRDGLDTSLLGMSFLNALSGWKVEGDRLTLRR